ncbi:ACP S-malonyltransferase [Jeotgalibacillus haloalkalitolerans]|uniref:Malonyl CoA-acyl carrier protein transacylase n=1 Tax=Jeotgalibacillus haloalkalitolerans TaxID=3104292 RepID=A0ABU5KL63_9BACL|nr:ACP S-malonyltransferase [Jeotgalibacillus sp. HH7-29]MDZ5711686.1 ACP S-malonyltransferase [Jeotgalibacillus sp. HH7-29]
MAKIAVLFPGQGAQTVGMGNEIAQSYDAAGEIFNQASAILGEEFVTLMKEGPQEDLTKTTNAQPALLTASIAILNVLKEKGIHMDYVAGHSLGEYSALVAADAVSFQDALKTVRKRGELMEEAVPNGAGGMAAVLGMDRDALKSVTDEVTGNGEAVQLANLNCPGQIVISGTAKGVEQASALAKERGAKRCLPLNVSGPFHSSLMKPAAAKFEGELQNITISDASVPVIANVTADAVFEADKIQKLLVTQLYSPVLWEDTVEKLIDLGVDTFIEAGPGKVLSGLVKKINRRATVYPVYDQETLELALQKLGGE